MDTPPPPPSPPPSALPPVPPPPPAKSGGNKALTIILCIVIGLFVLIGGCAVACTYLAHRVGTKMKEYSETAQRNPQMAALSAVAALQPDITVVSKNEKTGKMVLKNIKTGEVVTVDTNAYSADNISQSLEKLAKQLPAPTETHAAKADETTASAPADNSNETPSAASANATESDTTPEISPAKTAALTAALKKFPDYFTAYPGGKISAASINSFGGASLGNYEFTSTDKPDAITDFYEKKITAAGFTVAAKNSDANDFGPTATIVATRADPAGTFSVTAESQKAGTHVSVTFSQR